MVRGILRRMITVFKDRGILPGIKHVLRTIFRIFTRMLWDRNDLDFYLTIIPNDIRIGNDPDQIELKEITRDQIEGYPDYFDGWFDRDKAIRFHDEGDVLLGLWDSDRIIFFQWLGLKRIRFLRLGLEIRPPVGYCSMACMYTPPERRGQGIATMAKPKVIDYLRDRSFKYIIGLISPKNRTSRNINERIGGIPYQNVRYHRVLFLKIYRLRSFSDDKKATFFKLGKRDERIWKYFLSDMRILQQTVDST